MRTDFVMKTVKACLTSVVGSVMLGALCVSANAMPLNSSARAVVPADLQQLISVDYRALKDSSTAMKLKDQVLPENLKQFESALKSIGIDPEKDVDSLSFASFRTPKMGVKAVGVAAGSVLVEGGLEEVTGAKIEPKEDLLPKV